MAGYYVARFMYVAEVDVAILHLPCAATSLQPTLASRLYAIASFALIITFHETITLKEIPSKHDDGATYGKITELEQESSDGFSGLEHYQMRQEDNATTE